MGSTSLAVLAEDRVTPRPLPLTIGVGARPGRAATARRDPDGSWWRAEQGSRGPVLIQVVPGRDALTIRVLGDPSTGPDERAAALHAASAWAGLHDDLSGFDALAAGHPVLRRLRTVLGPPVLGALPRAAESFGLALLAQKVQGAEAARSTAALIRLLGTAASSGLTAYPGRAALHAVPATALRPHGISARSARALQLFAADEPAAQRLVAARDWDGLDSLVRRIPGCGVWTSAETRLFLGDADAVSYGDFHTATTVGWAIGERSESDEAMAELLEPFAGHRGRVVRLIEHAARAGLVPVKARRGPRAAVAAHRFGEPRR